jgi:hypothetical protein
MLDGRRCHHDRGAIERHNECNRPDEEEHQPPPTAVGCRRHCWSPLPAEQHRERRGRWKDLSRGRAEVRNGRCGRKPFDSRARRSKDRCWPTTVIGLQTGTVDPSRTFSSTLPDGSPRSEATIARSGSGPRRLSHETAGRYAPHVWSSAVASFRSGVSKPSVNQP